jgi:Ser/Thr protein kinase RdoA (MazF antagonist)
LVTADGAWAVKEPFDHEPQDEDGLLEQAAFQDAARAAGVPAPAVVRTADGDVLVDVAGGRIRVYSWVDLLAPDPGADPVAVGELLARLHRVRRYRGAGVHWWYTDPVGPAEWDDLVGALKRGGAPFAASLAAARDDIVRAEEVLTPPRALQLCHRDLWADNVLPTPDGGLCVIDWENAGLADPSQELAHVLFEFAGDGGQRARVLSAAYREGGGPGRVTGPGDFTMAIAALGHIARMHCRVWLASPAGASRVRAAAGVDEVLDRPLTVAVVDALLDAVAS